MLIRVRSSQGMLRVETSPEEPIFHLREKVASQLKISPNDMVFARSPNGQGIIGLENSTVRSENIQHGEILFVGVANGVTLGSATPSVPAVQEDQVDQELAKMSGRIPRSGGGGGSMRMSDLPIEPYDENYLSENKIKHMSFHAYIRKIQDRQKNSGLSLESNLVEDVVDSLVSKTSKKGKTQLNIKEVAQPIFLERQPFRLVDHVEFETSAIVDTFLQAWRNTGVQRFGYMYGRYEQHPDVPLGIKAVVSCIYEPPQNGNAEGVELDLPDRDADAVDEMAAKLGLRRVGMVYTDLQDDGTGKGKVMYKRHAETFFLSSPEVIFAAMHQNSFPNPSRYSSTHKFGSKFVTVVISGTEKGEIELEAYQVSNQAMAMVAAEICQATVEANVMRVVEADEEKYVPDVLFKNVNEFGTSFMHRASPAFPVEHLIVNVGHGFPKDPRPHFISPRPFGLIENRQVPSDYSLVRKHITEGELLSNMSDFHLLLFILKSETFAPEDFDKLLEAVRNRDERLMSRVATSSSFTTLATVVKEAAMSNYVPHNAPAAPSSAREKYSSQLAQLKEMGFDNEPLMLSVLHQTNGDLISAISRLTPG